MLTVWKRNDCVGDGVPDVPRSTQCGFASDLGEVGGAYRRDVQEAVPYERSHLTKKLPPVRAAAG